MGLSQGRGVLAQAGCEAFTRLSRTPRPAPLPQGFPAHCQLRPGCVLSFWEVASSLVGNVSWPRGTRWGLLSKNYHCLLIHQVPGPGMETASGPCPWEKLLLGCGHSHPHLPFPLLARCLRQSVPVGWRSCRGRWRSGSENDSRPSPAPLACCQV